MPPAHAPLPLFRGEALHARRPASMGDIVLLPGASSGWLALASLLLVLALVALVGWGSYTRRSSVAGTLAPSEGLIRVTAGQPGVVIERAARDGQAVHRGDPLLVLSGDRPAGDGAGDYQRGMAAQIEARHRSLEAEQMRLELDGRNEAQRWQRRLELLRTERAQLTRQTEQHALRIGGAQDAVQRYQGLAAQGFASRDELQSREAELADLRGRLEGLRREMLALQREEVASQRELDAVGTRLASRRAELERQALQARQDHTELEARRRVVVSAPADGRITLLQADVGQSIEAGRVLAQVLPAGAQLVARLYVPSRAAGFLQPGTSVLLRYDPYPFQKFGQHRGLVTTVSAAASPTQDLPADAAAPLSPGEPVFAVTVALPQQTLDAGGAPLPLHAGMRVQADLMHETRRLYEWILEPLYAARARVAKG